MTIAASGNGTPDEKRTVGDVFATVRNSAVRVFVDTLVRRRARRVAVDNLLPVAVRPIDRHQARWVRDGWAFTVRLL